MPFCLRGSNSKATMVCSLCYVAQAVLAWQIHDEYMWQCSSPTDTSKQWFRWSVTIINTCSRGNNHRMRCSHPQWVELNNHSAKPACLFSKSESLFFWSWGFHVNLILLLHPNWITTCLGGVFVKVKSDLLLLFLWVASLYFHSALLQALYYYLWHCVKMDQNYILLYNPLKV